MRIFKYILFFSLIAVLIFPTIKSLAMTPLEERQALEQDSNPPTALHSEMSALEERQALEEELKALEEQIAKYEEDIQKTQKEKRTLQNQIYILRNKIKKLDLQIYQSNVMIKDLGFQIADTKASITKTSLKIEDLRMQLANILKLIYEEDQKSLLEILLAEARLSDFFDNLVALEALNLKNQEVLKGIKNLKVQLEYQKESLDKEKEDLERMVIIQALQKREKEKTKSQREYLLEKTKGEEAKYQELLTATQKKAAEIRARIFELIGVPEAPTFGEAYEIAKYVERITGVRPAFLLAVMTQESNIGENVGQCYLVNSKTGEGVRAGTGKKEPRTMNPRRDVPHFLNICQELGRDPFNTLVSCPMRYGWGGAMGPAQFIPSTWMLYKDKVKVITAKPADPWNIKDAFLAAALYLADYGAANQTYNHEWRAAMIYFSGTTSWRYRFYGNSVMAIASQYAEDIKEIEKLVKL